MALQVDFLKSTDQNIVRPLANYPPSIWGFRFASFSFPQSEFKSLTKQVEVLKEGVKDMLLASTKNSVENIEFINLLCRLGVSYHFESEIEKQLNNIFSDLSNLLNNNNYDLYTTSVMFLVFRQHGFKMPCHAFNKFKDSDGKFNKDIGNDVRGVLSLYEASFLSVHGEDILDEALAFTREILESLALQSSPHLQNHINCALILPFHKGIPRLEARRYISFHQEEESRNEMMLKFSKLDFNRVQLLHQQELAILSSWYKELNLVGKLPYARDRHVELYLWAVGSHFEPQHELSRMMVTKFSTMISILDDTYDAYGTPEELQLYTDAFERCNIAAIDKLPDYMKALYKTHLNILDEAKNFVSKERRPYCDYYAKEAFKELVRSYHQESKWSNEQCVPPFEEYLHNGYGTSTYGVFPVASFYGMEIAGIKEFEWLQSNPKIAKASKIIGRLENDIMTHKDEQKRGDCASGVECYMKEYDVPEKKAIEELVKMCSSLWKDANEECMKPTAVSMPHMKVLLNLLRLTEVFYRHLDGYTKPSILKDEINSLFIKKVPIN